VLGAIPGFYIEKGQGQRPEKMRPQQIVV
jgi:hypothetical protein